MRLALLHVLILYVLNAATLINKGFTYLLSELIRKSMAVHYQDIYQLDVLLLKGSCYCIERFFTGKMPYGI